MGLRRPREREDAERVAVQRVNRVILSGIDVRVGGRVDNDVRRRARHRRRHGRIVADVEVRVAEGDGLVSRRAFVGDRSTELPARTDDRNAHQAARDVVSRANARIFASSNTPSQRATTAVAMQLPMTFTAVRPMSMI